MTDEQLQSIGSDSTISAPQGLQDRLMGAIALEEELSHTESAPQWTRRPLTWAVSTVVALALVVSGITLYSEYREPKDTYSDPYLAYAELERVFDRISSSTSQTVQIAQLSQETLDKTRQIINNL